MPSKKQAPGKDTTTARQQPPRSDVQDVRRPTQATSPAAIIRRARLAPGTLTPRDVLQMQRLCGNRAVGQMLAAGRQGTVAQGSGLPIKAMLTVGPVGDLYEQEADLVAEQVVSHINAPVSPQPVAGQSAQRQEEEEDDELQMMPLTQRQEEEEEEELQMMPLIQRQEEEELQATPAPAIQHPLGSGGGAATPEVEAAIQQARGGGQPLADTVREPMEQALGGDFCGVRVHADEGADTLNRSLGAKAFTTGQDIFFQRGEYSPGSSEGQRLIAHELTHVLQQSGTVAKTPQQPIIQRKYGFELELPIHVADEAALADYWEPDEVIGTGDGFTAKLDHHEGLVSSSMVPEGRQGAGAPIIELVTEPALDETKDIDVIDGHMAKLKDAAEAIKAATGSFMGTAKLNGVGGITCADSIQVGTDRIVGDKQNLKAYFQATYGVTLRNIGKSFEEWLAVKGMSSQRISSERSRQELKAFDKGKQVAESFTAAHQPLCSKEEQKGKLAGLSTLIGNYLCRAGSGRVESLIKNRLGSYFYKTKLSTVVDNLKSEDDECRQLLGGHWGDLKTRLLQNIGMPDTTGMAWVPDDPDNPTRVTIITAGSDTATDVNYDAEVDRLCMNQYGKILPKAYVAWLDQVLQGTDDAVFNAAKNQYSAELKDEKIGISQESGMVMEHRKYGELAFGTITGRTEVPPDRWKDMGRLLYHYLRATEAYGGEEEKAVKLLENLRKKAKSGKKGGLDLDLESLDLPPAPPSGIKALFQNIKSLFSFTSLTRSS